MPNLCKNKLTIQGSSEEIEQIKSKLFRVDSSGNLILDFNLVVPMPQELEKETFFGKEKSAIRLLKAEPSILFKDYLQTEYANDLSESALQTLLNSNLNCTVKEFIEWLHANPNMQEALNIDLNAGYEAIENISKYGFSNWRDWRIHHWGTKWNATTTSIDIKDREIICFFDTPYCYPLKWFIAFSELFSNGNITLDYYEAEAGFAGSIASSKGNCYQVQDLVNTDDIKAFRCNIFGIN
ncbi:hypothetical protein QJU87_04290 [Pasteurella skyensis]|uniref:hypothetical protein n=1 Tax=Phocoenobacter skyensis TaxID=97481 RepID=UPI0027461B09|nr:hypothetical protein [Pasteurella skyensis]MDP8189084.1 hypothetical protein [Pasteurella skyensis]